MGEKYVIPEVTTNIEWLMLTGRIKDLSKDEEDQIKSKCPHLVPVKEHQILLVDIFTGWSGACHAVESHLRRMRHSFVENPDCLALARACCDHIDDLMPFHSDIRPTFLFWARGGPVALLRGANRPLLTRLIIQEVQTESNRSFRPPMEIDFESPRVIQCAGDLAQLEDDDVVRSIGSGSTDRLSSFFGRAAGDEEIATETNDVNDDFKDEAPEEQDIEGATAIPVEEACENEENCEQMEIIHENAAASDHQEYEGFDDDDDDDDYEDEDEEEEEERAPEDADKLGDDNGGGQAATSTTEVKVEESAFGKKIRKRKKKMETRLLKEILNDVKMSSKRY